MKWMIASDIHGSAYYCAQMLDAYHRSGAERLLLLGDILYHGPRNDLPKQYAPKEVSAMLNPLAEHTFCVRGNCEAEVDQMMLEFPVLAEYALLMEGDAKVFVTHGHIYNEEHLPPQIRGMILLHGHTHVPACEVREEYIYMNPGSVSIPKGGSPHSYMLMEDGHFRWIDLKTGGEYNSYSIGE